MKERRNVKSVNNKHKIRLLIFFFFLSTSSRPPSDNIFPRLPFSLRGIFPPSQRDESVPSGGWWRDFRHLSWPAFRRDRLMKSKCVAHPANRRAQKRLKSGSQVKEEKDGVIEVEAIE